VFGAVLHFSGGFWILVAGFGRYQAGFVFSRTQKSPMLSHEACLLN
jgi:hypothetical protein